jgi:hypothetical protein
MEELRWVDPGSDIVEAISRAPAECIADESRPEREIWLKLGRMAFRAPNLLGGLAARTGMSCNTCHQNGHGRPGFYIEGVSGSAGTVDVTGSLFSGSREDGVFNPVPIPSLVDVGSKSSFGRMKPTGELRDFVRSVIVDEFEGVAPGKRIERGLLGYLAALRAPDCPGEAMVAVSLARDIVDVLSYVDVIEWALRERDWVTADFGIVATRAALGRIHQRFPATKSARDGLIDVSRTLGAMRPHVSARPEEILRGVEELRVDLSRVDQALRESSAESYYDRDFVRRSLAGNDG